MYLAVFAATYTLASWRVFRVHCEPRAQTQSLFTARLVLTGLMALDAFLILAIVLFGGDVIDIAGIVISVRTVQNPLLLLWLLVCRVAVDEVAHRVSLSSVRSSDAFWRGAQALMITVATFALACLPLIAQAFRLALSGRYVSQTYFWRSAPRGIDALAPFAGNPFHPLYGGAVEQRSMQISVSIESRRWVGLASCRSSC